MWAEFRQKFGFKSDRIAWGIANAGTATANAFGAKLENGDLIAKFGTANKASMAKLAYQLARLPGAEVTFIRNDGKVLKGREALSQLDDYRTDGKRKTRATLDEKEPPKKSEITARRVTLSGD